MRDFSIQKYRELCSAIVNCGYQPMTFNDYFQRGEIDIHEKRILIRHDVDRFAFMSLAMAEIEEDYGLTASYYFRVPHTFIPDIFKLIAFLGHQVGFYY